MPKFEDLTGQKFNKLTVIERVILSDKQGTFWKCKCDCGNEKIIRSTALKSGNTKSCGCLKKKKRIIDITGQRFGKLVVIKRLEEKRGKFYLWLCQCDCGKTTKVTSGALRSGNTKSCGCGRSKGLVQYNEIQSQQAKIPIGTKFGKLTVIEDLGMRPQVEGHNRRWYKCKCDCGEVKEVMGNLLKQGQVQSCGKCLSSLGEYQIQQILEENNINYYYDSPFPELVKETGRRLRFDFVIYDSNFEKPIRFIEFDGRQHMKGPEAKWTNSDSLETIKERDNIKNNFCIEKGYPLVRIPYTKINQMTLEDIMGEKYLLRKER